MAITDLRQIAKSAIETALSIVNESGEITPGRATKLLHALEADLSTISDDVLFESDGEPVMSCELVMAYISEAYPNEHAYRMRSPGDFKPGSFRSKTLPKSEGGKGGVRIIVGRLKGETTTTVQAYRFPANLYTAAEARQWLRDNDITIKAGRFEAATGEKKKEADIAEIIRKRGNAIILFDSEGKKELQRFEFGAGKDHEDETAARAAAKKREGQVQFFKRQREAEFDEIAGSLTDTSHMIEEAFHAKFSPADRFEGPYRTRDVFMDNPQLGNAVIVRDRNAGKLLAVPYVMGEQGVEFSPVADWREVMLAYQFVGEVAEAMECEIAESLDFSAAGLEIIEDASTAIPELGARAPVLLDAQIIKPGFGNKRDNNYYGAEMLRRDSHVFVGADVFVTNHVAREKTERAKVARIREIVRFTDDGAPVGRIMIYDPATAEKTRARAAADELDTMHFSIHASGRARPAKIDGRECKAVEAITACDSIDIVSRAGAGGRALNLAETETGGNGMDEQKEGAQLEEGGTTGTQNVEINEQEANTPAAVTLDRVKAMLTEAKVSQRFHKWIERGTYADEAAVTAVIAEAQKDAAELTEAGKPFGLGPVDQTAITEGRADLDAAYTEIEQRYGITPLMG